MTRRVIRFTKMHGAGNDYVYVNTLLYNIPNPEAAAKAWSHRHVGIGGDGLVLIGAPSSAEADFSMRIFNADGSEAMMCGNASRCVGKYLYERGMTDKTSICLETRSGVKTLMLRVEGRKVVAVTVDMLEPRLEDEAQHVATGARSGEERLSVGDREFAGTFVSMGNPHFVVFTDEMPTADVERYGALLERHEAFPDRCNIEFATVMAGGEIRVRVWERGSGLTMACGTGACATAVAAALTGRSGRSSRIVMDGGSLDISWSADDGHVYLTGGAESVFDGEIELDV